jgi:hypothetical protein
MMARAQAEAADSSVPWRISGSARLRDVALEVGPNLSAFVAIAVRERLVRLGREVPPPLPPKARGRKPGWRRKPAAEIGAPDRADRSVPWPMSGSRALADAARAAGPNLSHFVDVAVREMLGRLAREVPPPLPPKRNGRTQQPPQKTRIRP